jgi:lysozyme family protein
MSTIRLTPELRREYEHLFNSCLLRPARAAAVEGTISQTGANSTRYERVADSLGVPWFVVAVIHSLESSLNFTRHLHNGDPLANRTVRVPGGRPRTGTPPFTWEESAVDAISMKKLGARTDWSLAGTLFQLEAYNGWGYRRFHPHVLSPYLWSFSNHYISGKYVADGRWSESAVSQQCGAAVLLRRMAELGQIKFEDQPLPLPGDDALVVVYSMAKSGDPAMVSRAEELQRWLNTFPGIFVKVDGIPGNRTSEAYRRVTGAYLPGDPRN